MHTTEESLKRDIQKIGSIPFLPALLEVVCAATGLGFAAVARVTPERWIACAVKDDIQFGLKPGGELPVASTICHEIRQSHSPVIIDHVSHDTLYCNHHTPAQYGFESYISFPIMMKDGSFFGTLCGIDPKAAELNTPQMMELFTTLSNLISEYLDGARTLSHGNIAKLQMYTAVELNNVRRDMESNTPMGDESDSKRKMWQLSMKMNQLILALEPPAHS